MHMQLHGLCTFWSNKKDRQASGPTKQCALRKYRWSADKTITTNIITQEEAMQNPLINLQAASSEEANMQVDRAFMERLVLSAFDAKKIPLSARDVMNIVNGYSTGTKYEITSIRPRITELTNKGILEPVDRRMEAGSRKRVTVWMRTEQ